LKYFGFSNSPVMPASFHRGLRLRDRIGAGRE